MSVPCLLTWEGQSLNGRTSNLSQGGACIARTLTLPPQEFDSLTGWSHKANFRGLDALPGLVVI